MMFLSPMPYILGLGKAGTQCDTQRPSVTPRLLGLQRPNHGRITFLAFLCSAVEEIAFSVSGQRVFLQMRRNCRTLESLTASCHDPKNSFSCLCCAVNGARLRPPAPGQDISPRAPMGSRVSQHTQLSTFRALKTWIQQGQAWAQPGRLHWRTALSGQFTLVLFDVFLFFFFNMGSCHLPQSEIGKENRTLVLRWLDVLITSVGRELGFGLPAPSLLGWWSLFPAYFKTEGVQAAERRGVESLGKYICCQSKYKSL